MAAKKTKENTTDHDQKSDQLKLSEPIKNKDQSTSKSLRRSSTNKVIAGVAGGIGEYFNLDPTIVRLIFVLLTVFGGSGVLIYLILWIIMPSPEYKDSTNENIIKQNLDEMSDRARSFAHDIGVKRNSTDGNDSKFWWGFLIIILGILLLFQNLGIFDAINFEKFWPTLLILLGIILLLKKK